MLKVELGLDLGNDSPIGLKLDDPIRGKLDSVYVLGGALFYDMTDSVKLVSTRRGKNQSLGNYDSGTSSILLDNTERTFDPQNPNSPIGTGLIPGREVRLSYDNEPVYRGFVDDIDLTYDISGQSETELRCIDGLSRLASANIVSAVTTVTEKSGARVTKVLDLADVAWPTASRAIDTGTKDVLDTSIAANTNALEYLLNVTESEFGTLYIDKSGNLTFKQSGATAFDPDFIFTDDQSVSGTTKIGFTEVGVTYGTEFLYNRIVLENGLTQVIEQDTISQSLYGIRTLEINNLLTSSTLDLTSVAKALLALYKNPRYRFESIKVNLKDLSEVNKNSVLGLELGDLVNVHFTPNNIPPAIEQACRIVGISSNWTVDNEEITFSVEPFAAGPTVFILDTSKLDESPLA